MFQSIAIILVVDAWRDPSLASASLFVMFLSLVTMTPKAFDSFLAFWHDQMFQARLVLFSLWA